MKWIFIMAITLIVSGYLARVDDRLHAHEKVHRFTDTLTQPVAIYSGKHPGCKVRRTGTKPLMNVCFYFAPELSDRYSL